MPKVRLQGLDNEAAYSVSGYDDLISGAFLTNVGLDTGLLDDYDCKAFILRKYNRKIIRVHFTVYYDLICSGQVKDGRFF